MDLIRTTLLTALLGIWGVLPASAGGNALEKTPHLAVRGEAEIRITADQLRLRIGVFTEAVSVEEALKTNTERMRKVLDALHRAGLSEQEYETGRLRIEPRWSSPPRNPPPDWRPQIVGYSALNSLQIRTGKIGSAGELIAAAASAGANDIGQLVFALADPRAGRAEAIREAAAHALADARALAAAAGVRLTRIMALNLDQAAAVPMQMESRRLMTMDAAPPPVDPGEVTIRASVAVTYEIDPGEEQSLQQ